MNRDIAGYQRRTTILLVASSLTTALALFAVFRVTAEAVTASWIGAWSLLQGLFLVARVSDSGAGNNISRVIALRMKEGLELDLRNFSVASLLIASGPSIALTLATAPLIGIYITHQFENDLPSNQLWTLVWLALLTSIITAVSNILLAICEGAFELNYKSTVTILANAVGVMSIGPLLHAAGPAGIGWTYAVMSATQLLLGITRVAMLAAHAPKVRASAVIENARALWRENLHLSGIAVIRLSSSSPRFNHFWYSALAAIKAAKRQFIRFSIAMTESYLSCPSSSYSLRSPQRLLFNSRVWALLTPCS